MRRTLIRCLFAAALLLAAAAGWATRSVSYVLQNCSRADIRSMTIRVDPTSGDPVEDVQYQLRDAGGTVVKTGGIVLTLTTTQKNTLLSHIDTVVRPAVDTAEGL